MPDSSGHVSKETRTRALTFLECAEKAAFVHDAPLYVNQSPGGRDYAYLAFTDGFLFVFLFCTPAGYLVELHDTDDDGEATVEFSAVKNIRNFIFWLKSQDMIGLQTHVANIKSSSGLSDDEINRRIEEYMNGEGED